LIVEKVTIYSSTCDLDYQQLRTWFSDWKSTPRILLRQQVRCNFG